MQWVVYTDDNGQDYRTKVSAAVFAQVNGGGDPIIGGRDFVAADTNLPALDKKQIRPRHVTAANAANTKHRTIVCLTPTADLFTGVATSINLGDSSGTSVAYARVGRVGEAQRGANPAT
jgi:hypothetical protein